MGNRRQVMPGCNRGGLSVDGKGWAEVTGEASQAQIAKVEPLQLWHPIPGSAHAPTKWVPMLAEIGRQ
jgi:hypothetical protein